MIQIVIGILIGAACVKAGPWLAKRRDPWARTTEVEEQVRQVSLL